VLLKSVRREKAHLKHVEEDVKFDGILPSHAVIHLTRIRHPMQQKERPSEDGSFGEIALVRKPKVAPTTSCKGVVVDVGEEMVGGGHESEGKDGEGVEEGIEADDDAKEDDLGERG
jgi:hypothetical protein